MPDDAPLHDSLGIRGVVTRSLALLVLLLASPLDAAEEALPAAPELAVPRLALAPRLDGDPVDPAWAAAARIPALGLSRRDGGEPRPAPPTSVQIGWDAGFLYVRFTSLGREIYQPVTGHDADLYKGDVVELFLDVVGDAAATVELQVAPSGDTLDQLILITAPPRHRADCVLEGAVIDRDLWFWREWSLEGLRTATKARADGGGWITDIGIPAASALRRLGLKEWRAMAVRANFLRYDWPAAADGSRDLLALDWSTVMRGCPHISPSRLGRLVLTDGKPPAGPAQP